jgi:Fe-S-cluster-containing dehydrogenase component
MDQNDIDVENHQHPFRNAFEYEAPTKEGWSIAYLSISCQHCDDAPCITACPTGCLYKDAETCLTLYDNAKCIGCHSCAMACPFGAPSFNGQGKMVKCDGCIQRLHAKLQPACVRVCPSSALSCSVGEDYQPKGGVRSLRMLARRIIEETKYPKDTL